MKPVVVALAAFVASLAAATAASAESRYAVACIKNETRSNMTFSYKFQGNSGWKQVFLTPGAERIFYYEYKTVNQNKSPRLNVTYDAKAKGHYSEPKVLDLYASAGNSNCNQAKRHAFRYERTDKNFITLYHLN